MAHVNSNSLLKGLSGTVGPLLVRQYQGRTIICARPKTRQKESELQRLNRVRFKSASFAARVAMNNPEKKSYYANKARKLKYPNAYTAALTDFMRKGSIDEIDTRLYKGKAGNTIQIKASKKNFGVRDMHVKITDQQGNVIEQGNAIRKSPGEFIYKVQLTHPIQTHVAMVVSIHDVRCRISRSSLVHL